MSSVAEILQVKIKCLLFTHLHTRCLCRLHGLSDRLHQVLGILHQHHIGLWKEEGPVVIPTVKSGGGGGGAVVIPTAIAILHLIG